MGIWLSHHHLLKGLFILHWIVWVPLWKVTCNFVDLFLSWLSLLSCWSILFVLIKWQCWNFSIFSSFPSFSEGMILSYQWEFRAATLWAPHCGIHFHEMQNITDGWLTGILQVDCALQLDDFRLFRCGKFGAIHSISLQFRSESCWKETHMKAWVSTGYRAAPKLVNREEQ